jgi:methyltransferase (TIGR00027 family)
VAHFRACETQRPDALFRDPYAERLAGARGHEIANSLPDGNKHEWAWVARTYLFDKFISTEISQGAAVVVNLAAGLDARPYRMDIPSNVQWIEIDFPEILSYKEEILASEKPRCHLERIPMDLSDFGARRELFSRVDVDGKATVVVSEGLLIYFSDEDVAALASDLASTRHFRSWIIDLASPGQLKLMQRTTGKQLRDAGAEFKFAPSEGPNFFARWGWEAADVQGLLKTAAQLKRAPAELLSLLPEPNGPIGNLPWTGVCLLKKRARNSALGD